MQLQNVIRPKPYLLQVTYLKYLFETLKKHVLFKIVAVVRSTNSPETLNNAISYNNITL